MKPILFNTDMVRAILDRRKTETRRDPFQLPEEFSSMKLKGMEYRRKNTYKSEHYKWKNEEVLTAVFENDSSINYIVPCRYKPGDILYVREAWYYESHMEDLTANQPDLPTGHYSHRYIFKADSPDYPVDIGVGRHGWRPSIHMPREAARIFLRVKNVRVERLQEITINGIKAEGSTKRYGRPGGCRCSAKEENCMNEPCGNRDAYEWHTYKPADRDLYGWDADPWVRVIEFEQISREEATL